MAHRMHDGAVNAAHRMHLHPHSPKAKQPVDDSKKHPGQLYNEKLARHLGRRVEDLHEWMSEHHRIVKDRLEMLSWQSWGTDNQLIAAVQTLVNECALVRGRDRPEWKEHYVTSASSITLDSPASSDRSTATRWTALTRRRSVKGKATEEMPAPGKLLLICARDECGGPARLLQQQPGQAHQLPLSTRKTTAAFADGQVEPQWMPLDCAQQAAGTERAADVGLWRAGKAQCEVLFQRAREQLHILRQVANPLAQPAWSTMLHV